MDGLCVTLTNSMPSRVLYQSNKAEVFVSGEKVTRPNSYVGYMLQKDLLLPWRMIEPNVALGLESRGFSRKKYREIARARLCERPRLGILSTSGTGL